MAIAWEVRGVASAPVIDLQAVMARPVLALARFIPLSEQLDHIRLGMVPIEWTRAHGEAVRVYRRVRAKGRSHEQAVRLADRIFRRSSEYDRIVKAIETAKRDMTRCHERRANGNGSGNGFATTR